MEWPIRETLFLKAYFHVFKSTDVNSLRTWFRSELCHAYFLMLRVLFDKGVDVPGCLSFSVKGHRYGRKALKGMVWYYIESCSPVFVFRMIPSTRSDGEARALSPQRHSLVLRTVMFVL
jgi:hypothetical protein